MTARALMLQGTGSDVGKSMLTAALCRAAYRRGISVAPFKPQNMSNNAAACKSGGEIGRAQALQAISACIEPEIDLNPVLLKPQSDRVAQVVVHGKPADVMEASDYMRDRGKLLGAVLESFERLTSKYDLVIVEGAGSPAEVNLRSRDIANMGFARAAGVPVCLIGDIERGGVIAALVGSKAVLDPQDAAMIRGFLVNKFRGDPRLFDDGVDYIEAQTGWPCFGVIPWLAAPSRLPAEDAVSGAQSRTGPAALRIVAPMLSRMANFDDADPLKLEPGVDFQWVSPGKPIPRDADVIMLFGTKSTLGDLDFIRAQGWDHDIIAHARGGGMVFGICGGYQMLGRQLSDPDGVDGSPGQVKGLGLLDIETTMSAEKRVTPVSARCMATGAEVSGYEIHVGRSAGPDLVRPMFSMGANTEGARSPDGRISGTYLHGIFANDGFRRAWLKSIGAEAVSPLDYSASVEKALDDLADGFSDAVDLDALLDMAKPVGWTP